MKNFHPEKSPQGRVSLNEEKAKNQFFPVYADKICINLDWLQFFGRFDSTEIPVFSKDTGIWQFSEAVSMLAKPLGTSLYEFAADICVFGEAVALIQFRPRKIMGQFTEQSMSLQLHNHILYQQDWQDTLITIIADCKLELKNITRMDIAIDGANHVAQFLNDYAKQDADNKWCHLKGRAKMNFMDQSHKTMRFRNFSVGSSKSSKQIVVYDKSGEIETSNKKYIQRCWQQAGIEGNVWRVEMRLRSALLKDLSDLQFERFNEPAYLAAIFKTHAENFLDFVFYSPTDSNTRRQERIDLFNYSLFTSPKLTKSSAKRVNDRYKAKLSIHLSAKELLTRSVDERFVESHLDTMADRLHRYDLMDWFKQRRPKWIESYGQFARPEEVRRLRRGKFTFG